MEYIEHGDLSNYMRSQKGPVPEDTSRAITRQVLEALTVLHERQICHRDLKPQVSRYPFSSVSIALDYAAH